jgi:hypothetical protein
MALNIWTLIICHIIATLMTSHADLLTSRGSSLNIQREKRQFEGVG